MIIRDALREGVRALRYLGLPSPDLDAEVLFTSIARTTSEDLWKHPDRLVPARKLKKYKDAIFRRGKREPVAYITGRKEFFGREFVVNRDVLVPRPETELLVEEAIRRLPPRRHATVADVGTGSGCIAVSLAAELPHIRVLATDVSEAALRVARTNTIRHHVSSKIQFFHGDFLEPLRHHRIDLLVANLPYVPEDEVQKNPDLMYEPIIALRGQYGPEKTLETFLAQWYARDQRPTTLIEIHPNQAERILRENEKIGVRVHITKDFSEHNRIAIIEPK